MKANELMIGDWVNISQANVGLRKIDVGDISFFTEFEPIPLTAEILEKNGFWYGLTTEQEDLMSVCCCVPVTAKRSWVWEDEDGGVVVIDFPNESDGGQVWCHTDEKDSSLGWLDIIYVHELQHALRLCGLYDLADNFKV